MKKKFFWSETASEEGRFIQKKKENEKSRDFSPGLL